MENIKEKINWEENLKKNPLLKLTDVPVLMSIGVSDPEAVRDLCHDIIMTEVIDTTSKFARNNKDCLYASRRIQPLVQALAKGGAHYSALRTIELRLVLQMHTGYIGKGKPDDNSPFIVKSTRAELEEINDETVESLVPMEDTDRMVSMALWWI